MAMGLAHALTGGAGPSEEPADPAWAAVGSLDVGGRLFSATLIGRQHVITAAHVVAGANPAHIRFRSAVAEGFTSAGTLVQVHPGYTGSSANNSPGDPSVHADLAIVRLATPAPSMMPVARVFTGPVLGRVLTLVSHGGSTTLFTTGENRADLVFPDFLGRPATYLFDFDGPDLAANRLGPAVPANGTLGLDREATLANGDSGSAAFVHVDGRWYLAGVNTFNISFGATAASPRASGTGGGGVVLGEHAVWLREVLSESAPATGTADVPARLVVKPQKP
ncbi:hypothetical protein ASE11_16360 [Hydrogenophaga sp. Root209]|uniref:trypsin-like serine peptidase n=1 Tax=Hydrogenophaga sp. Root209 TaxID=1736490 RepID=UPI0006F5680F|nr:trypsin-like peptidase domain-containing protein [Hydrogenophaga sp. Root209]KRB96964.1 hypothetical protein ASE11_16360 [Hydrogenophaga sp. Root209]